MEDKTAKELIAQLKRIADALEKSNKAAEVSEKRRIIIEKLQEKNLKADLREKIIVNPEKVARTGPRLESNGSV